MTGTAQASLLRRFSTDILKRWGRQAQVMVRTLNQGKVLVAVNAHPGPTPVTPAKKRAVL
jgi:uncharacterized protein (DUF1697 family)